MKRHISEMTARLCCTLSLTAMAAACGGGGSDADTPTPAAADAPSTKLYMASAKAFTTNTNNPLHAWTYRAYCESGHLPGDGSTGSATAPAGGTKLLDNAWYFGANNLTLVVRTPNGDLLVFDPLASAADMKNQVIDQMSAAGLNPARIAYVFIGNEAASGYEGVNLILQTYAPAAKVVATKPAADAFSAMAGRGTSTTIPSRIDIVVNAATEQDQGSKLIPVASDVTVAAMLTPGATLGQMSVLVPVEHQGETQRVLVWSGNEATPGRTDVYGSSAYFVEGFVVSQGANAWFNTQSYRGALSADYRQLRADPNYATHLVMGTEGVRRWLGIFANCNRALAQRFSST